MIQVDEIQIAPSQIQFSMTLVETAQMPLGSTVTTVDQPGSARPGEINLSGWQVLVGWVSALSAVGLLLWAVTKLWLFEP